MYPRRNHNYILPLEKSLAEALKDYGTRFGLTIAVYGICLITFLLIININNIFQAVGHFLYFVFAFGLSFIGHFLYFVFAFGLSFIGYMFPIFATYLFLKQIMRGLIKHMTDSEESKRTEDSDKLTRK